MTNGPSAWGHNALSNGVTKMINGPPDAHGRSLACPLPGDRQRSEEIDYSEELGFDSVWLPEHHFSVYGTLGNPMTFAPTYPGFLRVSLASWA